MRTLIVEDEPKLAAYLRQGLSESGFVVDTAHDGSDAVRMLQETTYELAILDVMLPGRNGWSVLTEIRKQNRRLPVVFLTAKDAVEDRVRGLELGADDYLVKPFAFSELLARIRSVLRRSAPQAETLLTVADLSIDLQAQRVRRGDRALDLTAKEFQLLALLVRHRGEVISRTLIAEQVWDMNFHSTSNVVDVHIRRLRRKVDDSFDHRLIHTVRGVGYVLDEQPR